MKANQAKIEANMQDIVAEMKADLDAHVQELLPKQSVPLKSEWKP
jgi:hypothetical protein